MEEGVPRMSSEARLSTELVEQAEEIEDHWDRIWADHVITVEEAIEHEQKLKMVTTKGTELDEGIAITIAYLRRGPASPRAHRLQAERAKRQPVTAGAA